MKYVMKLVDGAFDNDVRHGDTSEMPEWFTCRINPAATKASNGLFGIEFAVCETDGTNENWLTYATTSANRLDDGRLKIDAQFTREGADPYRFYSTESSNSIAELLQFCRMRFVPTNSLSESEAFIFLFRNNEIPDGVKEIAEQAYLLRKPVIVGIVSGSSGNHEALIGLRDRCVRVSSDEIGLAMIECIEGDNRLNIDDAPPPQ